MTIIEKIKAEIERLKDENRKIKCEANERYCSGYDDAFYDLVPFLSTIESGTTYDTQKYTPRPSVSIEDVARVQFASHAKVFDKKRKAVFDWEQFKEVAGIFYGFGKKDHSDTLESEKPINPEEAMKELVEKIALVKQRGTWDGVDVEKYMDEVRDREPEKPVPNDLDEAAEKHLDTMFGRGKHQPFYKDLFIAGAKWQAEQFEKNRLAACSNQTKEEYDRETDFALGIIKKEHRQPTFSDAINYGMRLQKEKMQKEAVEGVVFGNVYEHWVETGIDEKLSYLNPGDKVKIIIVKEDEK